MQIELLSEGRQKLQKLTVGQINLHIIIIFREKEILFGETDGLLVLSRKYLPSILESKANTCKLPLDSLSSWKVICRLFP